MPVIVSYIGAGVRGSVYSGRGVRGLQTTHLPSTRHFSPLTRDVNPSNFLTYLAREFLWLF